jgi:hypothetical protein
MAEEHQAKEPQKWEYKMVSLAQNANGYWYVNLENYNPVSNGVTGVTSTAVLDHVARLGQEGWELVTSYSVTPREGTYPTHPTLVFKRPV